MVSIPSLWIPILLSAVVVFLVSWVFHAVLPIHRGDFKALPSESAIMEALRKFEIRPGDYMMPRCESMAEMKTPEYVAKLNQGPVAIMTVMKNGPGQMGQSLLQWFLYCVLVSILAAYVTGRALGPGASYLQVFRFAGAVTFIAHSMAEIPHSIWHHRSWSTTWKSVFDGLIYGLFAAGVFGWLWPK